MTNNEIAFTINFLFKMPSLRSTLTFVCAVLLAAQMSAQSAAPNFWTPLQPSQITLPETARQVLFPKQSQLFRLDVSAMRGWLRGAPMEFTGQKPLPLQMPDAAGQMRQFEVWESPVMAPELMAKYPGIRTYSARPTDGSGDVVRLGVGHQGFYAFLFRTAADIETLCPYAEGQEAYYMAYRLADLPNDVAPTGVLECGVHDGDGHVSLDKMDSPEELREHFAVDRGGSSDVIKLKKYRAAISAKGEYSKFHGNTKPLVLSAMVTAMNFIAAIMERDFSLRIELVANNDTLIYLDSTTDPYDGTDVSDWMEQNQSVVTSIIGSANFDIGHVFSVYVSGSAVGVAGGRVCNNGNKARACSSATSPNAAYFYLVTAHEMCHQMTGDHTWNTCTADLIPQRRPASTMEPGSGSTIMSYAGSCGSNNVQSSKDPYFNVRSIDQVRQFYTTGSGTCGFSTETDNTAPVVTITSPNNVYIPILTPFQLHATATDADSTDKLTYCWEQHDNGPEIPLGQQVKNSALFRSYPPISTSTSRYFPRIQNIITNTSAKAELLPDSTRQLNFRFTARDNHPGAGAQTWASIRLNSTLAAGPFVVTSPNKNTDIWYGGEYRTVTWDVANTDKVPVNCQNVNVLLSTDNGNSYEFVLAAGVPNNGSCCVKVPDIVDNLCRIRVEGVGNVFFDLSNFAFKIKAAENVLLLSPANGATGAGQSPLLTWDTLPDAKGYEVQVATSPTFEASTVVASDTALVGGSFQVPVLLEKNLTYYWRVRPLSECGPGAWTEAFVFGTTVGTFEPAQQLAFDLAPNPADESLRISFGETLGSDARLSLCNTAGQQLRSLMLPNGTLTHSLGVADLPGGVYIVRVQNERASGARKVVVRH